MALPSEQRVALFWCTTTGQQFTSSALSQNVMYRNSLHCTLLRPSCGIGRLMQLMDSGHAKDLSDEPFS
eukprot:scaffold4287_cov110-Skeletonema_dohrnii-CCMP3373.AAC.6